MEITIYGVDIDLENTKYETVGKIIDHIEESGLVITQVRADKKLVNKMSDEELEALKPIDNLEIFATEPDEIIKDGMLEAEQYISRIIPQLKDVTDDFIQGKEQRGYESLVDLLEGLNWLNVLLKNLIAKEMIENKEFIQDWNEISTELFSVVEQEDTVLLNDLLVYELVPLLEEYLKIIKKEKNGY